MVLQLLTHCQLPAVNEQTMERLVDICERKRKRKHNSVDYEAIGQAILTELAKVAATFANSAHSAR
jgi:transcriptional regulator NrdR family protein